MTTPLCKIARETGAMPLDCVFGCDHRCGEPQPVPGGLVTIIAGSRGGVTQADVDDALAACAWRPSVVISGGAGGAVSDDGDFISLAQPRDNPTSQAFRLLSDGLLQRGESEIRKALERSTGLQLEGSRRREMIDTLRGSGHQFGVRVSPDGAEAIYVDGRLVLTFEPTVLVTGVDGVVTASRRVKHWGPS